MENKLRKIVIFSSYFYPYIGGIERYVHNFAKGLSEKGIEVLLIVSNHVGLNSVENIDGFTLIRLPVFMKSSQRFPIFKPNFEFIKLLKLINNFEADFYVGNTRFFLTSLLAAILGKFNKKEVLIIEHGSGYVDLNNNILNKLFKIYEHSITFVLKLLKVKFAGVSKKCNTWLKNFKVETDKIVYNGISSHLDVDEKFDCQIVKGDFNVVYAGRLLKSKGIEYLTEAFINFSRNKNNIKLIICGAGELFHEQKEKYINNQKIEFLGEISNKKVLKIIELADVIAISSFYPEGLPTLLLEAGLTKCAVITTSQGGTDEVIIDDTYGYKILPKSVSEIEKALNYMYDHPIERLKMAKNLNQIVFNQFTWERIIDDFLYKV